MAGAPAGNTNAARGKRWREAILRALARQSAALKVDDGLDTAADRLVKLAFDGDKWAIDHLADRVDGKPAQSTDVNLTGDVTLKWPIPKTALDQP